MAKLNERTFVKQSKVVKEEIQNQDGWGDTIQDTLEPVFSNLEDLMYEVRNAVRGSYAVNGDTVEDLVQELRDCIAQLEEATDNIEFESHAITEKLVEPSKEDLKPIEDKFAELGLEIEKQGKTLFGNTHYQLRKELDHPVTSEDLGPIFDELCDLGTKDMPTTCNVGVHRDGNNIISAAVDVLKKQIPDKEVEESCEKEDNKLQEDAAMTDQERVKIFADYFDIEAEDCDYNAEDHTIESPVGDFYFGTYDEMVDRAIANESEMIDDMGLALFTPNFRSEIVGNPELYDMHWFAEYWDDYNAMADEEDEISYGDDEEAAQLYADTFGEEAFAEAVEKLLDKEAVTREVIKWDGVAGILAAYDGNEEDLGHGLYAYRWNQRRLE